MEIMRRELAEPDHSADFYSPTQDINLPYEFMYRNASVHEQPQIIRSIKSFRKKN